MIAPAPPPPTPDLADRLAAVPADGDPPGEPAEALADLLIEAWRRREREQGARA